MVPHGLRSVLQESASDVSNFRRPVAENRIFKGPCHEQLGGFPFLQTRKATDYVYTFLYQARRTKFTAMVDHQPLSFLHMRRCPGGYFCSAFNSSVPTVGTRGHGVMGGHAQAKVVLARAYRWSDDDDIAEDSPSASFTEGVRLFNAGQYYQCHDVLEGLWNNAVDPQRRTLHGILQCAVGLYHLLHQNHRGAMVELGEGIAKLRRVGQNCKPLQEFERDTSAVLEFVYNTQLEFAACSDDICITMDGSEQSYRLLGNFGAGLALYKLVEERDGFHIEFVSQQTSATELGLESVPPLKVKIPFLQVSEDDLLKLR